MPWYLGSQRFNAWRRLLFGSTCSRANSAEHMARPKVALLGVGAVGGTIAAALHQAGRCELTLIARGTTLTALRSEGLTIKMPYLDNGAGGTYMCRPRVVSIDETSSLGHQDVVFLVTKAHQLPPLIDALLPLLGPCTAVVPAMNGIPFWHSH
eukprot:SAG11_NODE_14267_length_619_cov_0.890385_1_plen_152_part_10